MLRWITFWSRQGDKMKKILLLFLFSLSFSFANTDYYIEDRACLGCKAYPPGHYKSCQTDKQHIYQ